MSQQRILIVEDEKKITALLRDYLEQAGYHVTILHRGDLVLPSVRNDEPDLIILDVMLPGVDGLTLCRELRKFTEVPIIMITAKVEEIDRLLGLELGADDYICKPFSPREVVARVKAVLRRAQSKPKKEKLVQGPISLDVPTRQVTIHETLVEMTPSEFVLLKAFMAHPNRVFTRNELLYHVQGTTFEGYDRTIDSHIKNLRKKIATLIPQKDIIISVYGVGYKLIDFS